MASIDRRDTDADRRADFEQWVRAEDVHLYRAALAILTRPDLAADAVQDTFERAWRSWGTLRAGESRRAWLTRICIHRSIDLRRAARLRQATDRWLRPAADDGLPPAWTLDFTRAYRRLSSRQRAVIALHYLLGYTLDESAALLGVRPGSARSHLARALTTLREELCDADGS